MKCKDCVHYQMCHSIDLDAPCVAFKNKADFVEVVRCKDCMHRSTDDFRSFYCRKDEVGCKDDGFCSDGERK